MEFNNNQERVTTQDTNSNNNQWFKINSVGGKREISLFVVVEMFRCIFYVWFVLLVIVGATLTKAFVDEDYKKTVTSVFGSLNVCAYFDFPPSTYVLPTLYAIQLVLIYQYSIVSVFRAWIAKEENEISDVSFILYSCVFVYVSLSAAIFSTIFAVQPDLKNPHTVLIHTIPFTNLIVALTVLQITVTWFGVKVSWKDLNAPKCLQWYTYFGLFGLVITSIFKVLHHGNSLGDLGDGKNQTSPERGVLVNVHDDTLKPVLQTLDVLWLVFALVDPMIQSGYLSWRKFDTHGVIFTIRDNKKTYKD